MTSATVPPEGGDNPTTSRLVEAVRRREDWALNALCVRQQPKITALVRGHPLLWALSGQMDVEDVVQEVWQRWLSADGLERFEDRGPGSLTAYMRSFVDHRVRDLQRRLNAAKRGEGRLHLTVGATEETGVPGVDPLADETTPTSNAREREIRQLARRILEPRAYRVWRLAVDPERRTSFEIAQALDLPASTVRRILGEALRLLAQRLSSAETGRAAEAERRGGRGQRRRQRGGGEVRGSTRERDGEDHDQGAGDGIARPR